MIPVGYPVAEVNVKQTEFVLVLSAPQLTGYRLPRTDSLIRSSLERGRYLPMFVVE